jgi:hypothetical protein
MASPHSGRGNFSWMHFTLIGCCRGRSVVFVYRVAALGERILKALGRRPNDPSLSSSSLGEYIGRCAPFVRREAEAKHAVRAEPHPISLL